MLSKRIIPCLDVREGKTTKGIKFKDNVDIGDPVDMARLYWQKAYDEMMRKHDLIPIDSPFRRTFLEGQLLLQPARGGAATPPPRDSGNPACSSQPSLFRPPS